MGFRGGSGRYEVGVKELEEEVAGVCDVEV